MALTTTVTDGWVFLEISELSRYRLSFPMYLTAFQLSAVDLSTDSKPHIIPLLIQG